MVGSNGMLPEREQEVVGGTIMAPPTDETWR